MFDWLKNLRANYVETETRIPERATPIDVTIYRDPWDDQGTLGVLRTRLGFVCYTLELPFRDNRSNVSRIPCGVYVCTQHTSPRFGRVFLVTDVQGRSYILFHSGNLAGDEFKGYKTHSHGCILLGRRRGTLKGQKAVLVSKPTVNKFMKHVGPDDFMLEIKEAA